MAPSPDRTSDVAIIGAGIAGSATGWACSRRGMSVALLEQFELGHVRGSSHGHSRIFRFAYHDPDYVRLAQRALPLWREAEKELGEGLLDRMGGLDIGPHANLQPIAAALSEAGAGYEFLSSPALRERFPAFAIPPSWEALFQSDGGVVNAEAALLGFLKMARRRGAHVFPGTKVLELRPDENGVTIHTSAGEHRARQVVISVAGWSNELLEPLDLSVPLTVTREQVVYYPPPAQPIVPFTWHAGSARPEFYGLPNEDGVKLGEHGTGPEVDSNSVGTIDEERLTPVISFARAHLPGLEAKWSSAETCLYAATPDDDFIMERAGRVILACGFGGHGFKFAPLIGELAADLVDGSEIPLAQRFARARFALA